MLGKVAQRIAVPMDHLGAEFERRTAVGRPVGTDAAANNVARLENDGRYAVPR
jgi:hypothetical protein